jgi:glycerol-3-phosphate acyltransferase PlsX
MSDIGPIKLAVDCMGGVGGPKMIIEAVAIIARKYPEVFYFLHGSNEILTPLLEQSALFKNQYEIINSDAVIMDHDKATEALKSKKNSSMRHIIEDVKAKRVDAAISAGNTAALMVTSRMLLGSLKGIKRPAIACLFPTKGLVGHKSVLLDMGANINCDEKDLSGFAMMGVVFAKILLDKDNPSVTILNVGAEETKGRELEQKTYKNLNKFLPNFKGFVEANEVIFGSSDVIVMDGFSGNIFLKASEGTAKMLLQQIRKSIQSNFITKICGLILKKHLSRELSLLDPKEHNGAMFLGMQGIVVKSHGNADTIAFTKALETAIKLANANIILKLKEALDDISLELQNKPLLDSLKDYFTSSSST